MGQSRSEWRPRPPPAARRRGTRPSRPAGGKPWRRPLSGVHPRRIAKSSCSMMPSQKLAIARPDYGDHAQDMVEHGVAPEGGDHAERDATRTETAMAARVSSMVAGRRLARSRRWAAWYRGSSPGRPGGGGRHTRRTERAAADRSRAGGAQLGLRKPCARSRGTRGVLPRHQRHRVGGKSRARSRRSPRATRAASATNHASRFQHQRQQSHRLFQRAREFRRFSCQPPGGAGVGAPPGDTLTRNRSGHS